MDEPLVPAGTLDRTRFWVLGCFSFLAATQSLAWFTYGAIPNIAATYYKGSGVNDRFVDLTLVLGPIAYMSGIFFFQWWNAASSSGLRQTVLAAASMTFACNVLRCSTCWVSPATRASPYSLVIIVVAQLLNGWAGCVVLGLCSELAITWFPANERSTATSIAYTISIMGQVLGFVVLPALADRPENVPTALYFCLALATLILLAILIHFPQCPRVPPSGLANARIEGDIPALSGSRQLVAMLGNWRFMMYMVVGGTYIGAYSSWSGLTAQILAQIGFTNAQAGWLGFANTAISVVSGTLIGPLVDRVAPRSLREILAVVLLAMTGCFVVLTLTLPMPADVSPWAATSRGTTVLAHPTWLLYTLFLASGLLYGAIGPLYYMAAGEIGFPVTEAFVGAFFAFSYNFTTMLFLGIIAALRVEWMNALMVATSALTLASVIAVPVDYLRSTAEKHHAKAHPPLLVNEATRLLP
eukprot:c46249_g1_i1.p1 GENE.c46249_g1_i1~~c46249_g1_i1.p1  ORF type:complete len:470 (+),score=81.61 c46249_g1_i1:239-1648(+)